jgi:hypothetical protein
VAYKIRGFINLQSIPSIERVAATITASSLTLHQGPFSIRRDISPRRATDKAAATPAIKS